MENTRTNNSTDLTKQYTKIYNKHYAEVLNYIKYRVQNHHNAEDITSITFERVWLYLADFDETKSNITTWLRNVANSCISNYFNGKNGNYIEQTSNVSDFVDAESGREVFQYVSDEETNVLAERNEFNEKVNVVFGNLKPKYRKVAILFFLQEKEYKEIAEICEIPIGSVKGMINRCRTMLQNDFQIEKREYAMA